LTDTKNGDGYDISGNVTKTKAMSGSQGMYFSFPSDATHGIQTYNLYDFTIPRDPVSMTGHISPTDANLTFTISNFHSGSAAPFATLEFVFSGKAWKDGAQLVTTGDHPTTTGQAKAAKAASPSGTSTSTSTSKPLSTIIGAAAGGGVLILLIVIGLVFCCCLGSVMSCFRRKKQQSQMNQQWQQQQQQQAPPVVQYGSAGQYTAPPPPAASAQYGARPQGQPQAYPPAYAPQQAAYHPPTGNPQY
jgi:hypothetical protein